MTVGIDAKEGLAQLRDPLEHGVGHDAHIGTDPPQQRCHDHPFDTAERVIGYDYHRPLLRDRLEFAGNDSLFNIQVGQRLAGK